MSINYKSTCSWWDLIDFVKFNIKDPFGLPNNVQGISQYKKLASDTFRRLINLGATYYEQD